MNLAEWSEAELKVLVDGYNAGDSFGQIAKRLPKSRCACIGKANRLVRDGKLAPRSLDVRAFNTNRHHPTGTTPLQRALRTPPRPNNPDPKPPKVRADQTGGEAPATARPWLTRLNGECRWPIGEPGADMLMCCGRAGYGPDGDYCAPHHRLGWNAA